MLIGAPVMATSGMRTVIAPCGKFVAPSTTSPVYVPCAMSSGTSRRTTTRPVAGSGSMTTPEIRRSGRGAAGLRACRRCSDGSSRQLHESGVTDRGSQRSSTRRPPPEGGSARLERAERASWSRCRSHRREAPPVPRRTTGRRGERKAASAPAETSRLCIRQPGRGEVESVLKHALGQASRSSAEAPAVSAGGR